MKMITLKLSKVLVNNCNTWFGSLTLTLQLEVEEEQHQNNFGLEFVADVEKVEVQKVQDPDQDEAGELEC